jgi:diguanylate cyclase (GGDEF)-like protein
MTYALAWLLLVGAVCTTPETHSTVTRRLTGRYVLGFFMLAVLLLLLRPSGALGWAVAIPAAVALIASGVRFSFALRESVRASEAFHLAQTDDLTGLPNRRALLSTVNMRLQQSQPLSLMLLDLDGFKEVNDTLGHGAGDTLLELVAVRLRDHAHRNVVVARVGGDEFAIVVNTEDPIELLEMARSLRDAIAEPMRVENLNLTVNASFGITRRQPDDTTAVDLLRRADIAMYETKENKQGVQLYNAEHDAFTRQRLQMGEELRVGIAKGQVVNYYQPKIDATTQKVIGFESLVRWNHPEQGLLPPVAFLSVARRCGLMRELSKCVVKQAIFDTMQWHQAGLNLNISINMAPPELMEGVMMPYVYELRDRVGLPAELLTIEVTEDSFLDNPERAHAILLDIRNHGLRTSIDDYGTGFSSLTYLLDLPMSEIKLDRSFVARVTTDERVKLVVASTIDMAHALGMELVVEGVEDAAISAEVVALGADILQGYHYSKPIPSDAVTNWVRNWNKESRVFQQH